MHTVWCARSLLLRSVSRPFDFPSPGRCKSTAFRTLDGKYDVQSPRFREAQARNVAAVVVYNNLLEKVMAGGGPKAIHRHTKVSKKMLVRDRLKSLLDEDSDVFTIGLFAGLGMDYGDIPCAGGLSMIGKVGGHYCAVLASDATVKGGTIYPVGLKKNLRTQEIAQQNCLPTIYLVDSGGAFLPMQSDIFPDKMHGGRTFRNQAVMQSLHIPQIAVVCGSCTAGGAYTPTMSQECIMVKGIGYIYLAGPPLVKAATGEDITDDQLGGADVHCRVSGYADHMVETEQDAFEICREIVPTLNLPQITFPKHYDAPLYSESELGSFVGLTDVSKDDIFKILSRLLDSSKFKEFKAEFGSKLITGFGHIGGFLVGVVANCGKLTSGDGLKGAHFVWMCEHRRIPLLFLQYSTPSDNNSADSPLQEAIALKDKAKLMSSIACTKVPRIVINVGGCYGDDNYTMSGRSFNPNFLLSWPTALTSVNMPSKDQVIKDLDFSKVSSSWDLPLSSAFSCAADVLVDAVILPEETRKVLIQCLRIVKHGELNQFSAKRHFTPIIRM